MVHPSVTLIMLAFLFTYCNSVEDDIVTDKQTDALLCPHGQTWKMVDRVELDQAKMNHIMLSLHPSAPSCFQPRKEWVDSPPQPLPTCWRQSGDCPSQTIGWLRCHLSFSLLLSSIQCIRGACSSKGHTISIPSSIYLVHSDI